jgi:hypothetical protein
MSLPIIGALLGHSQPQTTHRYAHLAAHPLRAASEDIASRISSALDPTGRQTVGGSSSDGPAQL